MGNEIAYEWDEAKNQSNQAKHGIAFETIYNFDWGHAVVFQDMKDTYSESRFYGLGMIAARLHAVIFTKRQDRHRIISLRKANARERKAYDQNS